MQVKANPESITREGQPLFVGLFGMTGRKEKSTFCRRSRKEAHEQSKRLASPSLEIYADDMLTARGCCRSRASVVSVIDIDHVCFFRIDIYKSGCFLCDEGRKDCVGLNVVGGGHTYVFI